MFIFGRLLGSVFVYLAFKNPIGLLIGFAIGYFFDRAMKNVFEENKVLSVEEQQDQPYNVEAAREQFMQLLFSGLGYLAKADGRVCEQEIEHAEKIIVDLGIDKQYRDTCIAWFQQGVENGIDNNLIHALNELAPHRPDLIPVLIEMLISLALADGHLDDAELGILKDIASQLGVDAQAFSHLLGRIKAQMQFEGDDLKTEKDLGAAYDALGVDAWVDDDGLKKAYRRLMSQHHPDKLMAQGVPEEAIKLATEKSQAIQNAYDLIKTHRRQNAG